MRKITVLEHITLDGVIQAGGGPDEDTSDGFAYGGWAAPFVDDDADRSGREKDVGYADRPVTWAQNLRYLGRVLAATWRHLAGRQHGH